MRLVRRWRSSFVICFLLMACIEVSDFGMYWDKGTIDPLLEGSWIPEDVKDSHDDQCISFVKDGLQYHFFNGDRNAPVARTLVLGEQRFLMVRQLKEGSGQLIRYRITRSGFALYALRHGMKDHFIRNYGTPNIVFDGDTTVTVKKLDIQTVELIEKIAAIPEYWEELPAYTHSNCKPRHAES